MSANEGASLEKMRVQGRFIAGADGFFWIAALSVVNAIIVTTGSNWRFVIGLRVT